MSGDGKKKPVAFAGSIGQRNRDGDKSGRGRVTAFYMETLVLAAVFTMVIVVLVQVFALSVRMSSRAKDLTCAVRLAENVAEAVAASESAEDLALLLDENGNAALREDGCVYAAYDRSMNPVLDGEMQVEATWGMQEDGCAESVITVRKAGETEPVYILKTGVYFKEEGK